MILFPNKVTFWDTVDWSFISSFGGHNSAHQSGQLFREIWAAQLVGYELSLSLSPQLARSLSLSPTRSLSLSPQLARSLSLSPPSLFLSLSFMF